MDDQFSGRTDDDLFFDEFEPVNSEAQLVSDEPRPDDEAPNGIEALEAVANGHAPSLQTEEAAPVHAPRSLLDSRHNTDKPAPRQPRQPASGATAQVAGASAQAASKDKPSNQASVNSDARLGSGANPRTKLTEDELAAKMEKMRILSAEKARKFEQAEQDERDHAQAYARGMEEARKRRQYEAERRRQGEEDRRRMEDERAQNRERKLKAIGMREGGWDEGKETMVEEQAKKAFRGANGGVRGTRTVTGLAGSRYAQADNEDGDRFGGEGRYRGRGRGRGGLRGRGGRGSFGVDRGDFDRDKDLGQNGAGAAKTSSKPALQAEDFPALPLSSAKSETGPASAPPKVSIPTKLASQAVALTSPLSPPVGDWGDEMEALDAKLAGKTS
jgi:hypothetical protein